MTRIHKVTGLGWLDSLLRLCPWASGDPCLLGAGWDSWAPSLPSSPWSLLRPGSSLSRRSLSYLTPKPTLWGNFHRFQASAGEAQTMEPRRRSPGSNPGSGCDFSALNPKLGPPPPLSAGGDGEHWQMGSVPQRCISKASVAHPWGQSYGYLTSYVFKRSLPALPQTKRQSSCTQS